METLEVIRDILEENLEIPRDKVTDASTFEDLGIDSLDMVELICDLEDRCGIEFNDEEGESVHNVGELVAYIDTLRE